MLRQEVPSSAHRACCEVHSYTGVAAGVAPRSRSVAASQSVRDGTTHLVFEPIELLERLAALTPRPRINLVLHHGVLASHSRWRARAVVYGRDTPDPVGPDAAVPRRTPPPWTVAREPAPR